MRVFGPWQGFRTMRWVLGLLLFSLVLTSGGAAASGYQDLHERAFPPYDVDGDLLKAQSALVFDLHTGAVLFEKNPREPMGPASLVKVATLALLFEGLSAGDLSMDEPVEVSENAWAANFQAGESLMWIEVGEEIPLEKIIQGISVASGNDASIAAAEHVAGSEDAFVSKMNELASRLGLDDTVFKNSHGLTADGQVTTAYDMAKLARYFTMTFPEAEDFTKQETFTYGLEEPHENYNRLVFQDPRVIGLKTGYTNDSGFHLVATARDGDQFFGAVIMGVRLDEDELNYDAGMQRREQEALSLLDWAFEHFAPLELSLAGEMPEPLRVYRGQKQYVDVVPERDTVQLTLPKDAHGQLEYRLEVEPDLRAPVADDTVIGSIEVQWEIEEGQVMTIDQWPLYPGETIERGGWWRQIWDTLLLLIQDLRAAILGMLD